MRQLDEADSLERALLAPKSRPLLDPAHITAIGALQSLLLFLRFFVPLAVAERAHRLLETKFITALIFLWFSDNLKSQAVLDNHVHRMIGLNYYSCYFLCFQWSWVNYYSCNFLTNSKLRWTSLSVVWSSFHHCTTILAIFHCATILATHAVSPATLPARGRAQGQTNPAVTVTL